MSPTTPAFHHLTPGSESAAQLEESGRFCNELIAIDARLTGFTSLVIRAPGVERKHSVKEEKEEKEDKEEVEGGEEVEESEEGEEEKEEKMMMMMTLRRRKSIYAKAHIKK